MDMNVVRDLGAQQRKCAFKEKYKKVVVIGSGTYGSAILVKQRSNGKKYVAKEVRLNGRQSPEKALHEIRLLSRLSHVNIVQYVESFENAADKVMYTIMEYAEGGDLWHIIKTIRSRNEIIPEKVVLCWFAQMCNGLRYLHQNSILHRDLKARNIFVTANGTVKIGDFGLSTMLQYSTQTTTSVAGTPHYFSPEICSHQPYNQKADIWALGCILYEMAALQHPYEGTAEELMNNIMYNDYPPINSCYSEQLKMMIGTLLCKDPWIRPSIFEVCDDPLVLRADLTVGHSLATLHIQPRHRCKSARLRKKKDDAEDQNKESSDDDSENKNINMDTIVCASPLLFTMDDDEDGKVPEQSQDGGDQRSQSAFSPSPQMDRVFTGRTAFSDWDMAEDTEEKPSDEYSSRKRSSTSSTGVADKLLSRNLSFQRVNTPTQLKKKQSSSFTNGTAGDKRQKEDNFSSNKEVQDTETIEEGKKDNVHFPVWNVQPRSPHSTPQDTPPRSATLPTKLPAANSRNPKSRSPPPPSEPSRAKGVKKDLTCVTKVLNAEQGPHTSPLRKSRQNINKYNAALTPIAGSVRGSPPGSSWVTEESFKEATPFSPVHGNDTDPHETSSRADACAVAVSPGDHIQDVFLPLGNGGVIGNGSPKLFGEKSVIAAHPKPPAPAVRQVH